MNGLMNGAVRMVLVQFRVNNPKMLPKTIRKDEKPAGTTEVVARAGQVKGEECLQPTESVGCAEFLADLASAGYVMVDAFSKVRQDRGGREYGIVRFTFVAEDRVDTVPEWDKARPAAEQTFRDMAEGAAWRTRAFLNPFFADGNIVEGAFCISVNADMRDPAPKARRLLRIDADSVCVMNA